MTDSTTEFAMEYRPTRLERIWRRLGFRYHLGDEPDDTKPLEGWMCNESFLHLNIRDRLRFLLTGKIKIRTVYEFDSPSPRDIRTRLDWMIYHPGQAR